MRQAGIYIAVAVALGASAVTIEAAPRDIQFSSVDIANGVVELHNFGNVNESLDDWRFCSHSDTGGLRYTLPNGLDGITLNAGESLFVHTANDAPADPDNINLSDIGGNWALPLDTGPYSLAIFYPFGGSLSFGSTDDMVDHLQWAEGGSSANGAAATRNAQAVTAGLWDNASAWINTAPDTQLITLNDTSGAILQGASDYTVTGPPSLTGDLDGDGFVGIDDLNLVLSNWNQDVPPGNPLADPSGDGFVGIDDLGEVLGNWNAGSPPAIAAVPEPATLTLIALLAAALSRRR